MWRRLLVTLLALLPAVATAATRDATVVLLVPPSPSGELSETLTRVHGELVADGLKVSEVQLAGVVDQAELFRIADSRPDAIAVVGLFPRADGPGLELWVVDQLTGKSLVTRVEVNGLESQSGQDMSLAPEVLSRRAVEVLRATLLEPWFARQKPDERVLPEARVSPAVAPPLPARPRPSSLRVGAGIGAGMLWNADDLEPALLPTANLRLAFGDRFFTRLSLAGLGTRPSIQRAEGSARVEQDLIVVDTGIWLVRSAVARPSLSLGAGALRVEAEAEAAPPYRASRDQQWALAMKASAAVSVAWARRWAFELELEGLLSTPYPLVRFDGAEVARFGRPSLFGKVMLVGWL